MSGGQTYDELQNEIIALRLCSKVQDVRTNPPISDGRYLAWNADLREWEIKCWSFFECAWVDVPYDRGAIWTHWCSLPKSPYA